MVMKTEGKKIVSTNFRSHRIPIWSICSHALLRTGDCSSTLVKVLCYKLKGRWFDPSWCQWIFHWHKNPSDRTMALGSTQPLCVPGVFPGGKGSRCVRLTTYHHPVPLSRNLETLTSWNPLGHSRPVMWLLFYFWGPLHFRDTQRQQ